MEKMNIDSDLTYVGKAQTEKKSLRNTLSSIYDSGLKIATGIIFLGAVGLSFALPGKSIRIPEDSTLSGIAQQYETTWPRLAKRNKLENPDYIQAGQDLIIYNKGPIGLCQEMWDIVDKYIF